MSYLNIVQMAGSPSLLARITASFAEEGHPDPQYYAQQNIWKIVAASNWDEAWGYAVDTATVNQNPDVGARDDVINDNMIKTVVQSMMPHPEQQDA